jgi:sugar (pentulose or hexulose) kinase
VLSRVQSGWTVEPIGSEAEAELLNWDAKKYRWQPHMTLPLGIDVGTSVVRTAVLRDDALVSTARASHPTQDPTSIDATLWWQAVADCLTKQMDMLRAEGSDPTEIKGIALDGTSGSKVLTDADLTPAMEQGIAVTSLGSSLAIKILGPDHIDDPRIGFYSHRLGDVWLGAVLAKRFSTEEIVRMSESIYPENPTGLNYYPLNEPGERFPINDPSLPPSLEPRPTVFE